MGSVLGLLPREGPADRAVLSRMAAAAPHRGERPATAAVGDAVVAATSVPDLDDGSVYEGTDLAVAFSGTLDNAADLRRAWFDDAPEPASPARIVAAGIARHGVGAAARQLRGVFAVAASDGRELWAFRDQLGFHPIAWREDAQGLFVATEPKQIVAGAEMTAEPDLDVLEKILYGGLGDDPRSALAGVLRLSPATVLGGVAGRVRLDRYWDPEPLLEASDAGADEIAERFHRLVEQAVDRCLAGRDVVSLSGGIDSPAVAAFAAPLHRERTGKPLAALTAVFPDHPSVDEARFVEALARELGVTLHTYHPTARPTDELARWVRLLDGPVPVVAFSQVFEFLEIVRGLGFRNVLSGELEEFVFEMGGAVLPHLLRHGRIGPALGYLRERRDRGASPAKLARMAAAALLPPPARRLARSMRGTDRIESPPWVDPAAGADYRSRRVTPSWRDDQLVAFRGSGLSLGADDTIQAAAGVRERRPFADVDLWEFALGLPAQTKHGDPRPKALMRRLLRGTVPDVILDRREKTVFDAWVTTNIDYEALCGWLLDPAGPPVPGVRYDVLARRLEREELGLREYMWAKDLAGIHAFLSLWENGVPEDPA